VYSYAPLRTSSRLAKVSIQKNSPQPSTSLLVGEESTSSSVM
jgi:hypothetical protein